MSKDEMIQATVETMNALYYEDVEFFYGFLTRYANKKGLVESEKRGNKDARCLNNS